MMSICCHLRGNRPNCLASYDSVLSVEVDLDETKISLKGFVPMRLPSEVIIILLGFQPIARDLAKNRIMEFRPEILPINRSYGP